MPHDRERHAIKLLTQKLAFSPVVAIQGSRQTGKSYLVRELLPKSLRNAAYVSFDQYSQQQFAQNNPESFLAKYTLHKPLIIDEAQKVPVIFDAIKFEVDRKREPGRFIVLGSTEFSKLTRVRESLTGRMSRIRLYPLNTAEAHSLPAQKSTNPTLINLTPRISRSQLMRQLNCGGLPAIFSIRNDSERSGALQDWLDLTCKRDSLVFAGVKINGDLCSLILEQVARLAEPNLANLAQALKVNARRLSTHLEVLKTLFVLNTLPAHPSGTGKEHYFLCDVGLASHLGADFERQLQTWILNEYLSQFSYRDIRDVRIHYYRAAKGGIIHFVLTQGEKIFAVKIIPHENIDKREFEILKSFRQKNLQAKTTLLALGGGDYTLKGEKISVYPWESIA